MRTLALLCLLLLACTQEQAPTQIVISVDTDYEVPQELDEIHFEISKQQENGTYAPPRLSRSEDLRKSDATFPLTLAMTSVEGGRPTVRVRVEGRFKEKTLVKREAIVSFREKQILALPMNLLRACENASCGTGETCVEGGVCESVRRDDLDPWSASPPRADSSVSSNGGMNTGSSGGNVMAEGGTPEGGLSDGGTTGDATTGGTTSGTGSTGDASVDSGTPIPPIAHIAVGDSHSCAVTSAGSVYCWGDTDDNRSGPAPLINTCPDENVTCSVTPILIPNLNNAVEVALGAGFSCARTTSGEVRCWGSNGTGCLGNPGAGAVSAMPVSVRRSQGTSLPTTVLNDVAELHAGRHFACARRNNGQLACWGYNESGQLGLGTADNVGSDLAVTSTFSNVSAFALGNSHGCYIDTNSSLYCWGNNDHGQVGRDPVSAGVLVPHRVFERGVTSVSCGDLHTCAVVDGVVKCFGLGGEGQLGIGFPIPSLQSCPLGACSPTPFSVDATITTTASQVALGTTVSCVRYADGRIGCFGRNDEFAAGQPSTTRKVYSPTLLSNAMGMRLLAARFSHACAAGSDKRVFCWGYNEKGQLGPSVNVGTASHALNAIMLE